MRETKANGVMMETARVADC